MTRREHKEQSDGIGPEYGLNPGASGPDYAAYQLPKSVRPAAVTVPNENGGSVIVTLH